MPRRNPHNEVLQPFRYRIATHKTVAPDELIPQIDVATLENKKVASTFGTMATVSLDFWPRCQYRLPRRPAPVTAYDTDILVVRSAIDLNFFAIREVSLSGSPSRAMNATADVGSAEIGI